MGKATAPVPDAAAAFARLRERVRPVKVAAVRPAVPDVAGLVDAELTRREQVAAGREQAAQVARLRGGPCDGCGQVMSVVRQEYADGGLGTAAVRSEVVAYWRRCGPLVLCFECDSLRGQTFTPDDLKGAVAHTVIPESVSRYWLTPAVTARVRQLPLLWSEHPGLPTRDTEADHRTRYGFVDVAAVLEALKPPALPYRSGPACPRCGEPDRWLHVPSELSASRLGEGMVNVMSTPGDRCGGCGHFAADPSWRGEPLPPAAPTWTPNYGLKLDPTHQGMG